ncbi:MAG: RDD family protein [Bifidobacteriaceae bacterium]|nr:RDD family protein [Bifidobacteriaceae bacterium]
MQGDEVVVGEAVKLELRPASFGYRLLAFLLDFGVIVAEVFVLTMAWDWFGLAAWDAAAQTAAISAAMAVVLLVIPATVETLSRGRSVGKLAVGIRVVQDDGAPLRARQAFIRTLAAVFEVWLSFGSVAFLTMLFNDRGKRVGDFLAGAYVMRVRGARLQVFSLPMPPELAAWAQIADLGTLGDSLALRVRQFLLRANSLSPHARERLALDLAAEVASRTAPPPPAGTHPERYLTAVICERRNRELAAAPLRAARAAALTGAVRRLPYQVPDPPN